MKRQAKIRHQEWLAEQDRRKRAEGHRRVEESTRESRAALGRVIERWRDRVAVEHFFEQLEMAIGKTPEAESRDLLNRLQMAQEFVGSAEALDFFRAWRTPSDLRAALRR